jgi:regulator of RNase E activity RraA
VSALDSGHYGVLGGSAHETALDRRGEAVDLCSDDGTCGGVAVYPDDILFGDDEAVVVIPAHIVDEIAHNAWEMEEREKFLLKEIEAGLSIIGVYPPSEETMEKYRQWRAAQEAASAN